MFIISNFIPTHFDKFIQKSYHIFIIHRFFKMFLLFISIILLRRDYSCLYLHQKKLRNLLLIPEEKKLIFSSLLPMLILGFFGGAFIALGYLLDIHVIGTMPQSWGSFTSFSRCCRIPYRSYTRYPCRR